MTNRSDDVTQPLSGQEIKGLVDAEPPAKKASTYTLHADAFGFAVTVNPIGTHLEEPHAEGGKRVMSHPAEGGEALSQMAPDGSFRGQLRGPLLRGKKGEPRAVRILEAKLRSLGHDVKQLPTKDGDDASGVDARDEISGNPHIIQVVLMPANEGLWAQLGSQGTAQLVGPGAVELVRASIEKKRDKAKGAIVVLDAAHIGALLSQELVDAYVELYGDPNQECGFAQTWIVGPTEALTFSIP
jgi:hypothetical protein